MDRAWVTEAIRPGVVAASHHLGRWRRHDQGGVERWASAKVARETLPDGRVLKALHANPAVSHLALDSLEGRDTHYLPYRKQA